MTRGRTPPRTVLAGCAAGLVGLAASVAAAPDARASGGMTAQRDAIAFAAAIARDPSTVKAASFARIPPNGNPAAVGGVWETNTPPLHGTTLGVLSTGDATIDYGVQSTDLKTNNGGGAYRGANDVVTLKVTLAVPATSNCVAVAVAYFTEDTPFPDAFGASPGSYVDGFLAELDPASPWAITGSVHAAPLADFARTSTGDILDAWSLINSFTYQATTEAAQRAAGTAYNAAMGWHYAMRPVSPGTHTVELSVFDRGDSLYDSSAVLDDLRLLNRTAASCSGLTQAEGIDLVPPTAPSVTVKKKNDRQRKVKLAMSATDDLAGPVTFECSLDGKAFAPCTSPAKLKRLKRGKHVFAVRATDAAGNISATSTMRFKIKRVPK